MSSFSSVSISKVRLWAKLHIAIVVSLLLLAAPLSSYAQRQAPIAPSGDKSLTGEDEQHAPGSIEEEMRVKREIKFAEEEHKETLERAREVSELASKLRTSFCSKKALDRDDNKRIERIEKLTKQLRNRAGGSSIEIKIEKPPSDLEGAVELVATASESLSSLIQKTPRRVVSTAVIDEANVLLQLIGILRQFSH